MIRETRVNNRLEQDKKVRQNQISELIKIFEEDQIQIEIAQQFSIQLEQAAFELSGGENTREYRTRLNTVKIRLNGTKGQFIRQVLVQKIMTPLELMAFDMSKLNENSIQIFLEQNNRQFPQKNNSNKLTQKIVVDKDLTQNSNEKQKELNNDQKIDSQQEQKELTNQQDQNKPTEQIVSQIQTEIKQQQIENVQPTSTITETDKIDFAPQEEPIQQFEEYIDYSFEYNQKQRDFVEGNDFPNIEELQINEIKQNNQQDDQFANNSPLPSDNVLNQEFLQDDPQLDGPKENVQTEILDSQIQQEEQKYYDHECSFQIQEQQLIDVKNQNKIVDQQIDHQLAEFAVQNNVQKQDVIQNIKQESNNIHTHHFEQQIYQKLMEQHLKEFQQYQQEQLPKNYEEFFSYLEKSDLQFENQINQLINKNNTLKQQFYQIQIENQIQQENLEIQNLNCQNRIQQLINENNILKLTFQQNEQSQQQLLAHLKEQSLIEKAQFQQVYQNQLSNQQKHKEFLEQIRFNLDYRRDTILKLKQQNQLSINLDDEIGQIQDILAKQYYFEHNYQSNPQPNDVQAFNQQYWASENDVQIIGTMVNADSGSTQIRRNKEALNTEVQEEVEQFQVSNEVHNFGEIIQTRTLQQQHTDNTQLKNSTLEQISQEQQQQNDQFQNKRINNIQQKDQDVLGLNNREDQSQQDLQKFKQIKTNNHNKESEIQMNQQIKRQQVKRSNVPESLFD